MLRSPLQALGRYRGRTAVVALSLAVALWLVAALVTLAWEVEEKAYEWWDHFVPVVYLESGVDAGEVDAMVQEIEEWPRVSKVRVEGQEAFLERLMATPEWDEGLGLEAAMMPTALVVRPSPWFPGEAEAVARVEALEVRESVLMVDAPGAESLEWVAPMRRLLWGVGAMTVLGLVASFLGLVGFLRGVHRRSRREYHLMERFGMRGSRLRSPSLWRGVAMGTGAGVVAAGALLVWLVALRQFSDALWGGAATSAMGALVMAVVLGLSGVLVGALAGWMGGFAHGDGVGDEANDSRLLWELR